MNSPEVEQFIAAIGAIAEITTKMYLDMVKQGMPPEYAILLCQEVVRGIMSNAKSSDPDA